jgi:hypothetical protein
LTHVNRLLVLSSFTLNTVSKPIDRFFRALSRALLCAAKSRRLSGGPQAQLSSQKQLVGLLPFLLLAHSFLRRRISKAHCDHTVFEFASDSFFTLHILLFHVELSAFPAKSTDCLITTHSGNSLSNVRRALKCISVCLFRLSLNARF